jgi:hypothetical protein
MQVIRIGAIVFYFVEFLVSMTTVKKIEGKMA